MKNLYISDLHLFHGNVIKMCNRPFNSIDEMHRTIINNWNNKVNNDDMVYILGDISLGHTQGCIEILKKLKGKKTLIIGNHDKKSLKNQTFCDLFEEITIYKEINDNGQKIVLFHYPIEEWNGFFRGYIHLFGHVHDKEYNLRKIPNRYNVCSDVLNFIPSTLEEIIQMNELKEDKVFNIIEKIKEEYTYEELKLKWEIGVGDFIVYDKKWKRIINIVKVDNNFIKYEIFGSKETFTTQYECNRFYKIIC